MFVAQLTFFTGGHVLKTQKQERTKKAKKGYIDQLESMMTSCEDNGFSEVEAVMLFAHGIVAFAETRSDALQVVLAAWENVEGADNE